MRIDIEDIPDWKGGFDYCRRLINHGFTDEALEVYRGGVLAYTIRSIFEGSELTVSDSRHGTPKIKRFRGSKVLFEDRGCVISE